MRPQQIYIGVGVGALSIALWGTVPARAEEPAAKPEGTPKALPKPAAAAKPAAKPKCKAGMVFIPAGTFTMGDDENSDKAGKVTVEGFCMDRTEVSASAYEACVASGKCTAAESGATPNGYGAYNAGILSRKNHPINGVTGYQATAYCEAQGLRLPTEEEWEYAARGTDGRLYPWGNSKPTNQLCWNSLGNRKNTCAVGSFPNGNSPFGLSDMSGNVWEWTSSAYSATDTDRVIRGGSWHTDRPSFVRSTLRFKGVADGSDVSLGFRCAGSPLP